MTPISAKLDNSSSDLSLNLGLIKEVSRIPVLFCTYLDLTPAHPDMFAKPDVSSVIQLPWKKDVAWVAADCWLNDSIVDQAPRDVLKHQIRIASQRGIKLKSGVEPEFFLISKDGERMSGQAIPVDGNATRMD